MYVCSYDGVCVVYARMCMYMVYVLYMRVYACVSSRLGPSGLDLQAWTSRLGPPGDQVMGDQT